MYLWLLFLHIATVLGFMLAHGVQVMDESRAGPPPVAETSRMTA